MPPIWNTGMNAARTAWRPATFWPGMLTFISVPIPKSPNLWLTIDDHEWKA
jgi:hypothetical protein